MSSIKLQKVSRKEREFYLELHKIADKAAPKVKKAFLEAMQHVRDNFKLKDLVSVVQTGNIQAVAQFLQLDQMQNQLQPIINELVSVVHGAAVSSVQVLPATLRNSVAFDLFNPRTVQFLRDYKLQLVANSTGALTAASERGIRTIIADAFNRGGHPREQARRIRNLIGLTERQAIAVDNFRDALELQGLKRKVVERRVKRYAELQLKRRATTIARTETIRAANMGQEMLWRQAQDNGLLDHIKTRKVWVNTPDDRLCPICRAIPGLNPDGVPVTGEFKTQLGMVQEPPAHPNCVIGDSAVHNAHVLATSDRFYKGIVITIKTASGNSITCTPNHPILTLTGWKPAGEFQEGDKVVQSSLRDRVTFSGEAQNENVKPVIAEVVKAFSGTSGVSTAKVPLSTEDFHGDGTDNQVAIIGANSQLLHNGVPVLDKKVTHKNFIRTYINKLSLYGNRGFAKCAVAYNTATTGFVRTLNLFFTLFRSKSTPFNSFGLTLCSKCNIVPLEKSSYSRPAYTIDFSKLVDRHAGNITVNKVIGVTRREFSGHVYNLQTVDEMYTCNGIVTHNCRCATALKFIED